LKNDQFSIGLIVDVPNKRVKNLLTNK